MAWDHGLLSEQRAAAGHVGSHARLLAGPGTGKTLTLTRRIWFLVEDGNVEPDNISVPSGQPRRSLTRFLRDAPIAPVDGLTYVNNLQRRGK